MSYHSNYTTTSKAAANSLTKNIITYLREKIGAKNNKELEEALGLSTSLISQPWFSDLPEIAKGANVDLGVVLRDSSGNEVTFWSEKKASAGNLIALKKD